MSVKKFDPPAFWTQQQLNSAIAEELNKLHDLLKKLKQPEIDSNMFQFTIPNFECNCNNEYCGLPCIKTCPKYRKRAHG